MNLGTIIFYKNKFGILTQINDTNYSIIYEENLEEVTINKEELDQDKDVLEIPTYFIDELYQKNTFLVFKKETKERMQRYYTAGRVENFYVNNGKLYSTVTGTRPYEVEINFSGLYSCSCPVKLYCKHIGATMLKLKSVFSRLQEAYSHKLESNIDYTEDLGLVYDTNVSTNLFSKYFEFEKSDYIYSIPAIKLKENLLKIKNFNIDEKTLFVEELYSLFRRDKESDILSFYTHIIYMSKDLSDFAELIDSKKRQYTFYQYCEEIKKHAQKISRYPSTNPDKEFCIFKKFLENNYTGMIKDYFNYFGRYTTEQKFLILALEHIDNKQFNEDLLQFGISLNAHRSNLNLLVDKINPEHYEEVLRKYGAFVYNGITFNLDRSIIFEIIRKNLSETAIHMLEVNFDYLSTDYLTLFKLIFEMSRNAYYFETMALEELTKKLPHSAIVQHCLCDRYVQREKPFLKALSSEERIKKYEFTPEDITTYCDIDIETNDSEDVAQIIVYLKIEKSVIAIVKKQGEDIELDCTVSLLNYHVANFLYDYVMTTERDYILQKEKEVQEVIDKRLEKERLDFLNESITKFSKKAFSNLGLTGEAKANLELYLTLKSGITKVEVKIGKEGAKQYYKVKSLTKLVEAFLHNEVIAYGKSLTFTHNTSNLNPPYDRLVEYFTEIMNTRQYSSAEIDINTYNIKTILQILKDTNIYINDELTNVKLDKISPKYSIDKDYKIDIDIDDKLDLYKFGEQVYAHDKAKGELNLVDVDKKDRSLFEFFVQNRGTSIESVKEQFRDVIYSLNQDKIMVDEVLNEDFKINDIEINAYFDYQSGKISVKTKYVKDDTPINLKDIVSGCDISKINTYNNYLETLGFIDDEIEDDYYILNFFELDFSYLKSLANVYLSDSITNKYVYEMKAPIVRIEKEKSMVEAFLGESEYSEDELKKILKAIKLKKKYILLNDNQIVKLDEEASSEFYHTLEDFNINLNKPFEHVNLPIYQALKAYAHEKNCEVDDYLDDMVNDIKNYKESKIELPSVNAELRSYQQEGVKWLTILKNYNIGGILADDMGLGKTLQVITLITGDTKEEPSLIVCPKSLVFNWKNEFEKFSPNTKVIEIYGTTSERQEIEEHINKNEKTVFIVSYDSLGRDVELLSKFDYNFLVLDEAQNIKNVNAKRSENVKSLRALHRFALTGTPIENNVIDLWSIFDFLMPNYFESTSEFRSRYLHDESFTQVIAKKVAPFILRRTKKDVLKDLPSKYERVITCDMNEEQKKYYDALRMDANEKMQNGGKVFDILPYLTRLRQICIDPGLFIENTKSTGSKLVELFDIINDYKSDHKMLIFSQFVQALNKVEEYLKKNRIPYYIITGQTDSKERLIMCNKFNNDKTPVFLISLKAGGTGLNLIGADTVIHIDPWWNSSAEDQATDRAHRIGQTRNVEVIKLIMADSIEQKVVELQNSKKDIIDKLIASDDNRLTSVTLSDLAFILK